MSFNFGATPFKHEPMDGYPSFEKVSSKHVVDNTKSGGSAPERKLVANAPQAIIIEPSRELAEQTLNQLQLFKKHLEQPHIRELLVVGGVSVREQIAALRAGVDIVVATPGRLEELLSTNELSLKQCRFFILDEADGLLKVRRKLLPFIEN